jgi:ATP-dependent RNA helicase DDX54/DBP10
VQSKAPAIFTAEEDTAPFGLRVNEIVRTPLGVTGTVLGIKYSDAESKADGKVWVRYGTGQECPLELHAQAMGYERCSDADHIRRDIDQYNKAMAALDKQRQEMEALMRMKALGIEPPTSGGKKGAKKKKKK